MAKGIINKLNRFEDKITPFLPTEIVKNYIKKRKEPALRENDFMLDWNTIFGWKSNPFIDKVLEPIQKFYVHEKKEKNILNTFFIRNFNFGTITGPPGTGKTALLKWLVWELSQYKRKMVVAYVDASKGIHSEEQLIKQIINPMVSIYEEKVLRPEEHINNRNIENFILQKIGRKTLVLLIDEADKIPPKFLPVIHKLKNSNVKLQLIIAGQKKHLKNTEFNNKDYADRLKVQHNTMNFDLSREMIKKRIEYYGGHDIFPFDNKKLKLLLQKAEYNPKKFLKLCYAKAIQLSLLHREKLIEMKKEMERMRAEEEKLRKEKEKELEEQGKKMEDSYSNEHKSYLKQQEAALAKLDQKSGTDDAKFIEKIDDVISKQIDAAVTEDKKKIQKEEDEVKKNEELISAVTDTVKEEKPKIKQDEEDVDMDEAAKMIDEITKDLPKEKKKTKQSEDKMKENEKLISQLTSKYKGKKKTRRKKK